MKLKLMAATALVAGVLAAVSPAYAASPHFKKGGEPVCTVTANANGSKTVRCTASLAGLGNEDLVIRVSVDGTATFLCGAPGNANVAPGQNKFPVTNAGTTTVPASSIKNGNVTFTTNPVTVSAPTVTPEQAGCPNKNWQVLGSSVLATRITMTIIQGGQTLFTCSASSAQGLTGTVPLSC
jgi:hypothetical protein